MLLYIRVSERDTILLRPEVDVTVTERVHRHAVSADANGSDAPELHESREEVVFLDVWVEVSDVKRCRNGGDRRGNRHW